MYCNLRDHIQLTYGYYVFKISPLVLKIYFYLLLILTSAAKNDLILIPMCRRMKFLKAPALKISFHGTLLKFLQFYTISCNINKTLTQEELKITPPLTRKLKERV